MADLISLIARDVVGIITLDNPPVNGLNAAVRKALAERFDTVLYHPGILACVIIGAGRMFSSGADIKEFGQPTPAGTPALPRLIDTIEKSDKPVVAAIHGVAAGGGLELALGCHYRLATSDARVGLPEVTLGIVPGAGGTQRLPRLIGARAALEVILSGELVAAARALELGIIDHIVQGKLLDAAVTFAEQLIEAATPPHRTRDIDEHVTADRAAPQFFDEVRQQIAKRARGLEAPFAALDCVEAAVELPFDEGMAKERETFQRLVTSDQARALRHVFFAERAAAKIPDVPPDTAARPISRTAVVGLGTMGMGIAACFANAGIPVRVLDASRELLDGALLNIRQQYGSSVAKGRLSQAEMDGRMGLISPTDDFEDLGNVDLVIEAVFEDMPLKKEVFAKLDRVAKPDAILATNTSTLDVDEIASATTRPDHVIGTHFFSPAHVMRLLETVRGAKTSADTIATVMRLAKQIGKIAVLVRVCDGFVGNRMLYAYRRQADFLLEEGALPHEIDRVLYDFGFPMGPYAMADLAGLDVGWRIRKAQAATRPIHRRYSSIADRICEMGRFGQKTGAGWYRYQRGSRTPIPDPEIEALIKSGSAELGIGRRTIGDEEILQRCLYPLINEGAKILEEGIALRASDIDVIWIHGYGFPRHRGGPMFWADTLGLPQIHETLRRFYDVHGEWLRPAPLLEQLAGEGKGFKDLDSGARR